MLSGRNSVPTHIYDTGSKESDHYSHTVDSQLELQELGYAVVHVSAPHDGFDDAGKIVISQDNIGGFLGYICTWDTLREERKIFNYWSGKEK